MSFSRYVLSLELLLRYPSVIFTRQGIVNFRSSIFTVVLVLWYNFWLMCLTVYSVYSGAARYFGTQNVKCKSNNADMLASLKVQKIAFQRWIVTWPTDSNEYHQRMDYASSLEPLKSWLKIYQYYMTMYWIFEFIRAPFLTKLWCYINCHYYYWTLGLKLYRSVNEYQGTRNPMTCRTC